MEIFREFKKDNSLKDKRVTLAEKHRQMMKDFAHLETKGLSAKQKERARILAEMSKIEKSKEPRYLKDSLLRQLQLELESIECVIESIKHSDERSKYILSTTQIVQKYLELEEKTSKRTATKITKDSEEPSILDYFAAKEEINEDTEPESDFDDTFIEPDSDTDIPQTKTELLKEYLTIIGEKDLLIEMSYSDPPRDTDICNGCSEPMISCVTDGTLVCEFCGNVKENRLDHGMLSYKQLQERDIVPKFAYKRINHFSEWMCQFQGKESTVIPEEVYTKLLGEIKKYRLTKEHITQEIVREFLKKLSLNKYYEHIPFIINRLTGLKAPVLEPQLERQFRVMFIEMQEPFERHKPSTRKNFLSYSYVLHKFCELTYQDHLLCRFPLLKSREKLLEQDRIFKKICHDLGWEFIASV